MEYTSEQRIKRAAASKRWRANNIHKCRQYSIKHRDQYINWRMANKSRIKNSTQKKLYGISLDERDVMFTRQGYACAACGSTSPGTKKGWHTDHCHKTKKVRGILCQSCNIALGYINDSIPRLKLLISYLEKNT